jgi:hypothetical protein
MTLNILVVLLAALTSHVCARTERILTDNPNTIANEFQLLDTASISHGFSFHSSGNSGSYSIDKVFPTRINSRDVVTIVYSSSKPSRNDWIAAYSPPPATEDLKSTVPVKYGWADDGSDPDADDTDPANNYLTSGKGALRFNFTNLRADIAFYYFTGNVKLLRIVVLSRQLHTQAHTHTHTHTYTHTHAHIR